MKVTVRKLSETSPKLSERKASLIWKGRTLPLFKEASGTWRLRSRSRHLSIDLGLGTSDLAAAKRIAKDHLDGRTEERPKGAETLEDLVKVYLSMPKRCGERAATDNVQRLRSVVRLAWERELGKVRLSEMSPKLWRDFMAAKLGGVLDLATRRPGNAAINAAVRSSASIFIPRLRPAYAEHGFNIPEEAIVIQWLPVMHLPPSTADDAALIEWWASLPQGSPEWFAVGLARFAGLRSAEIAAARSGWVSIDTIELRDRPEEGFLTKTGKPYRALILRPELTEAIRASPESSPIVQPPTAKRSEWFERDLPRLVRPFCPTAKKPLHRLRGLYADEVARLTQNAVAARLAGIREASAALGHTTTAVTLNHYLTPQ